VISIIIPVWNEVGHLPATLAAAHEPGLASEVIVVEAGTKENTGGVAPAVGWTLITSARRQRAAQMNLGASRSQGELLLFLHADTRLYPGALSKIQSAMADPGMAGGGFARRFASHSPWLGLTSRLADYRGRVFGWLFGDQAIFIRRTTFNRLGGYPDWDLFEDLELSRRMKRHGRVVLLEPPITSSARRFQARGPVLTTLRDLVLTLQYFAGVHPNRIATRLARLGEPKKD